METTAKTRAVLAGVVAALLGAAPLVLAQSANGTATRNSPRSHDYRGPQVVIPGVFVTPVPNAPFSARVKIVSHDKLPDGSEHVLTTSVHIARASSGVMYNERRTLMPVGFAGEPRLLQSHIYDPSSRRNTYLDPYSHLAREATLSHAPAETPGPTAPGPVVPGTRETDLGEQVLNGVTLHGLRRQRTIAADRSGTGKELVITDDYWYAPALSIYLILRHDDPRTGEQLVAVTDIDRAEPDANLFRVPDDYKVVDETPLPRPAAPSGSSGTR